MIHPFILYSCFLLSGIPQALGGGEYRVPTEPPKSHYKIDVRIDLERKRIEGNGAITFTNHASFPLEVLAFDWSVKDGRSLVVSMDGEPLILKDVTNPFSIPSPLLYKLPKPVTPGSKVILHMEYSAGDLLMGNLEEIRLVQWYPRIWWDGLSVHDSFEVMLDAPSGYAVAASGRLNEKTGRYENRGVMTFGLYLGKGLEIIEGEVDGVLVSALHRPKGAKCAKLCFETAKDVIAFYKDWLGFFPFEFLSIIPGASRPMGGCPFTSGIVVIHGQEAFEKAPLLHWKWITAHEIGHEYWGEYVMEADFPTWLWIGMGIYADREYMLSRNLGLKKHDGLMWNYLNGMTNRLDTTVDIPPAQYEKITFDHNNIVEHGKGFSIISALACALGRERFHDIYRKCLKEYGGRRLGYREFWRFCEEESGENLGWFFEQWVRSNKYPCYRIISRECEEKGGRYLSRVEVKSEGTLKMPVPVKATFEDGTSQVKRANRLYRTSILEFESDGPLEEVVLDPTHELAMLDAPLEATKEDLHGAITRLPYTGSGEEALELFQKAKELGYGNTRYWFKFGLTLFDGGYLDESFEAFHEVVASPPSELYHFSSLVWMGHLKDLKGEREEALKHYGEALKHDTGRSMTHSQYGMSLDRKWVEKRLKEPFSLADK